MLSDDLPTSSLRKDSRVSDAKHPIKLESLFYFILNIKYSKGFRERGALRVCNGPVDVVLLLDS